MSKPVKPLYVGAVLQGLDLGFTPFAPLVDMEGVDIHASHITLQFFKKGKPLDLDPWAEYIGREVTIRPKTIITSDKVILMEVEVDGVPVSMCKPHLHLTIATKDGGSPKDSNAVLSAIYDTEDNMVEGIDITPWTSDQTFKALVGWRCVRTQTDNFTMPKEASNA